MKKLMKNKKGFTIVELVIVIAVIGILAGVLIPTFGGIINRANESSAVQLARTSLTNVLSGNVQNGTLNSAEFVINNGSKTYQFSYANGKLDTEDSADGSVKAGEDNVGHGLTLEATGEGKTAFQSGDTNYCEYKKVKSETLDDKAQAAIKDALKLDATTITVTITDDSKYIVVKDGAAQLVSFEFYLNSDFDKSTVAFIK